MTSNSYTEDLTKSPFTKIYDNLKTFRLCRQDDYDRVGIPDYIQGVKDATG